MSDPLGMLSRADRAVALEALREFYSVDDAVTWLNSPHHLLANVAPVDLLGTDRAKEVFALIDQLRSGAYI